MANNCFVQHYIGLFWLFQMPNVSFIISVVIKLTSTANHVAESVDSIRRLLFGATFADPAFPG